MLKKTTTFEKMILINMSKILITGNGFDLFHHLPTKYHHFISIMETIENFGFNKEVTFEDLFGRTFKDKYPVDFDSIIDNYSVEQIKFDNSKIKQIDELLKTNLWYKHFKNVCEIDTWIDFEMEIETILNQVSILLNSETLQSKKINQYRDVPINYSDFELFGLIEYKYDTKEIISIPEKYLDKRKCEIKRKDMFRDLAKSFEDFIIVFNRYLVDVVSVFYAEIKQKSLVPYRLMDEIYTFNYTPTLERFYNVEKSKVVYLHGQINQDSKTQNLVLGISDISTEIKASKMFDFTKYYQKIRKNSNHKFIKIPVEKTIKLNETIFYIIGHSLDESDKEYIADLFKFLNYDLRKNAKICIFYFNMSDMENKLKNLFNIMDKDVVIDMNKENRLYFVELNEQNIKKEFEKVTYKHQPIRISSF
jgi:hypothetical protein